MVGLRGSWRRAVAVALACFFGATVARANPALVVDVDSGDVLYETMATTPWYPASLTKLMTTYVALSAVREGRITLNTPLMVSQRAARMAPSKMGFRPGTLVTLDNALKMLMVKSPNDVAVTVAEGVAGSVEAFADEMNAYGSKLGLHESHFVNPNGLPDPQHVSSARDMAMIGRALQRDFPEQHDLFDIGLLSFGSQLIHNHNGLLGRYDGIDGMKTGYTCSAGYNVVLSAQRGNRRLITVVMGAPSNSTRSQRAVSLFDRYFAQSDMSGPQLSALPSGAPAQPPDLRSTVCGRGRANAIAEAESEDAPAGVVPAASATSPIMGYFGKNDAIERANTAPATSGPSILATPQAQFTPVRVFVGPVEGWTGRIARPRDMDPPIVASRGQATQTDVETSTAGPKEAPAPAPMALLGATPLLPATLATGTLVRKTKPLSLSVRSARRRMKAAINAKNAKEDAAARGTTPSILASDAGSAPAASATKPVKLKPATAPAPKPKPKLPAKASAVKKTP